MVLFQNLQLWPCLVYGYLTQDSEDSKEKVVSTRICLPESINH